MWFSEGSSLEEVTHGDELEMMASDFTSSEAWRLVAGR